MTDTSKSCMWSFRCDLDLREAVKSQAEAEGRTASSIIRDALRAYVTKGGAR